MLIADADRIAQADWFVGFVRANGIHNVPLFLALPGSPGHLPVRARINGKVLEAAVWDSPGRVAALITQPSVSCGRSRRGCMHSIITATT